MRNIAFVVKIVFIGICLSVISCSESEEIVPTAPSSEDLSFTFSVDAENPNLIHFVGQTSVETWFIHWNFGDNTGDEGLETSKVFFKQGAYDVRLRIFTEGGTAEVIQRVVIEQDFQGPDLIENGTLDGDNAWTILQINTGAEVVIANGEASWSGGSWGNAAIYQQVEVEANKEYQINMDISGGGLSDCWFEVYVGTVEPVQGVDYSDGGILIGLSTWEGCGTEAFSGLLTDVACVGDGGAFTWPEDSVAYFVIKSGGANLGDGVTIDNIAVRSL